jgi:hypothetical protein
MSYVFAETNRCVQVHSLTIWTLGITESFFAGLHEHFHTWKPFFLNQEYAFSSVKGIALALTEYSLI